MRAFRRTLCRALIASALAGLTMTPALAETADGIVHKSRQVRYADLDLTTAKDVARLNGRVRSAARAICDYSGYGPMQEGLLTRPCMADVLGRAARDVEVAILSQRGDQLAGRASSMTIGVTR